LKAEAILSSMKSMKLRPHPHYARGILKTKVSLLKTYQMFSVHTTPDDFINSKITGHFGFLFEEISVREIT